MDRTEGTANTRETSADDVPIACSLSAVDLGEREDEWRALLDAALVGGERIPSGVRITVQPSDSAESQRLVELDRACCAWMQFDFDAPETVAITAPSPGADVLAAMFLDRDASGPRPETS